jgi:hypothetical protein
MTGRNLAGSWGLLAALALPLAGCADYMPDWRVGDLLTGLSSPMVPPPAGTPAPVMRGPMDPLSQFASANGPGGEGSVVVDGVAERARVLRAYNAASGQECREVLLGSGGAERAQLVCGDAAGFQVAQPLLRGAGRR